MPVHNRKAAVMAAFFSLIMSLCFITGCVSTTVITAENDPMRLFSADADLYVCLNVKGNEPLVTAFLQKYEPSLTDENINAFLKYVSVFYAAKKGSNVEIAAKGKFPAAAKLIIPREKNGFEFAFLGKKLFLCSSGNTSAMIERLSENYFNNYFPASKNGDMLFYVNDVSAFMPQILGTSIKFGIKAVSGAANRDLLSDAKDTYLTDADFYLVDNRAVKAAVFVLGSIFSAEVSADENGVIHCKGIKFPRINENGGLYEF